MHQQAFTRLQAPTLKDIVPDGEEGLRQGGCLREGEAVRHRQRVALVHRDIFGIASARRQSGDTIADPPARST